MITVVAIGPVAVTTNYWEEYQEDGTEEIGCRVQLRAPSRGPVGPAAPAAPRCDVVVDRGTDLAGDLFTTVGSATPLDASHYHPTFTGIQPCERVFDPSMFPDPHA